MRIAHEATAAYLSAWLGHPWAMIRHTAVSLSETQLHQAVRPTETVRDVLLWNTGRNTSFGRDRTLRGGSLWQVAAVIAHRLVETLSVVIFAAFLAITPLRLLRGGLTAEACVAGGLWVAYLVWGGLYAAVHLEPRYLSPVVAGSIVIGVANSAWLVAAYRRGSGEPPVGELSRAN